LTQPAVDVRDIITYSNHVQSMTLSTLDLGFDRRSITTVKHES